MNKAITLSLALLFSSASFAETISLPDALERALNHDPRISELEKYVEQARALKEEAEANYNIKFSMNSFLGMSPALEGGFFTNDSCGQQSNCELRVDRYELKDGISPWLYVDFSLIKPLSTFGKIENYIEAAEGNIKLKQQDVRLQRGKTIYDVKQAYFGYLAARDGRLFLEDVASRINSALETVQFNLDEDNGSSKGSDLYALQSAVGLARSYLKKSEALETVAIKGLKVLVGIDLEAPLEVTDRGSYAVELPDLTHAKLIEKALLDRPEMLQLKSGLSAQRSLIEAGKAMSKPNLYAGFAGALSYSPMRDRVDNPHIYDPFNDVGSTPIIGVQWEWEGSVQDAKVRQEKAKLLAITEKGRMAQLGIPYQVSESIAQVSAHYDSVAELKNSAKAARRWMISLYTEFEAGLEPVDKLVSAFQAYVLSYSEYLQTVYQYNLQVARLEQVIGEYQ